MHDLTVYATTRESQWIVSVNRHSEELSILQPKSKIGNKKFSTKRKRDLARVRPCVSDHSLRDEPHIGPISGS